MKTLTLEKLKQHVSYDPETGLFVSLSKRNYGKVIGHENDKGYIEIRIDNVPYRANRLAFLWMTGEMPTCFIDHKNRVKSDNHWLNLRPATRSQNAANMGLVKTNSTGMRGVSRSKERFSAAIEVNQKRIWLGRHDTVDEAAHAYNKAAILHFGEYAVLNPIGIDK